MFKLYFYSDFEKLSEKEFSEITENVDVIIDFSNPATLDGMLEYIKANNKPDGNKTVSLSSKTYQNQSSADKMKYAESIYYNTGLCKNQYAYNQCAKSTLF